MAKLYVFGIGGTGSRVIKSLTMLLASGVKLGSNIDTVVPMIIDPDVANGDLTRTQQLLDHYQRIHDQAKPENGFFSMPIRTLSEISTTDGPAGIRDSFNLLKDMGDQNQTFGSYIGYDSLSRESKAFIELLFSDDNRKADMTVGFKGHPNIGSVVLNQFKAEDAYQVFLSSFSPGDSIFLISSIFGGTGAAGFPLILRNLRTEDPNLPNSDRVADATIGALSMLPYFKVDSTGDGVKSIDSSTFVGKAKAALDYYSHSIFGSNKQLNVFYSIGEDATNTYDHHDGAQEQKNNAHFLELAAAMAVVDFTERLNRLKTSNGQAENTEYLEFGIDDISNSRRFNLKKIGSRSTKTLLKDLSKFALMTAFHEHFNNNESDFSRSPWFMHLESCYKNNGLYDQDIARVEAHFKDWIKEMDKNDIAFSSFNLNISYSNLLNLINDFEVKSGFFKNNAHGKRLDKELNREVNKLQTQDNMDSDLIGVFDRATEQLIDSIINN